MSEDRDEPRLLLSLPCWWYTEYPLSRGDICSGLYVECRALDEDIADILLSLPRPLMPLFEFLYSDAKYSHNSLSSCETQSPGLMVANFCVRYLSVAAWNLFWCDCVLLVLSF